MKTEVIMKRKLFGTEISQKSKSEFFSATELVKAGNKWRMLNEKNPFILQEYLRVKSTIEFIQDLEEQFGKVIISRKGRSAQTWVHPFLFIDVALAISPKLKIETYQWIMDSLLKYRNDSGDSYKKMCGALYFRARNKSSFPKLISDIANRIKLECGVSDWQSAKEKQLELRDRIQENVFLLSDIVKDIDSLVKIAIKKAKALIGSDDGRKN